MPEFSLSENAPDPTPQTAVKPIQCQNLPTRLREDPEKIRNMPLFGTENFRSWMLYFEPGDGTPMHYHQSPETFLVIDGKCSVKSIDGAEQIIEKNQIIFLAAKDYYQLTNVGTE